MILKRMAVSSTETVKGMWARNQSLEKSESTDPDLKSSTVAGEEKRRWKDCSGDDDIALQPLIIVWTIPTLPRDAQTGEGPGTRKRQHGRWAA